MENPYTSYEQLPLTLDATHVAKALGISKAKAYELMHSNGFPSIQLGTRRLVVPKSRFIEWINRESGSQQFGR